VCGLFAVVVGVCLGWAWVLWCEGGGGGGGVGGGGRGGGGGLNRGGVFGVLGVDGA